MSQHSSSWLSFILRLWCGTDRSSTAHGKNKRGRSRSSSSNNIPFSAEDLSLTLAGSNLPAFTLAEMKTVTRNFSPCNKVGSGGFGTVYKGFIPDNLRPGLEAQYVAVKDLDLDGLQGHREWLTEVMYLGQLTHPNLVKLIGYCWEDERRLVVYEFMNGGNLEDHLFKSPSDSLSWSQRMKIAVQTAKGLAFLHEAEKQIIYRDFKASNILLDSDYTAKLSDFGLAKEGPQGGATHVSTRVMGTNGYAAPEYIMTGHLTTKSDVYSFGVVLLELLTNKRAIDTNRKPREHNLVEWAKPCLNKPDKLYKIMDQSLGYSREAAQKAAFVAYQCLSMTPKRRPHMREVVNALEPILEMPELLGGSFVCIVVGHESCENIGGDFEKVAWGEDGETRNKRRSPISAIHDDQMIGGHFMEPRWREEIMKME